MIEKLRLRGFTGIKRGLGLDEITVDFTGISGLIALDGANGLGKTTLLDNMHPFACLGSRPGALKNHCFLRDSEKEFIFTHMGHRYRTLIKIDAQSENSEGFIYIDNATKSETVSISSYKKWILKEFGTEELFFSGPFGAQNGEKISDMKVAPLKKLFAEFLRLERYAQWEDTAKQAGNVLEGMKGQLESRLAQLQEQKEKSGQILTLNADAIAEEDLLEGKKILLSGELSKKRLALDTLKETLQKNALALERKKDLQTQIERLETEMATEKATAADEVKALQEKWKELAAAIKACDAILQDRERIEKAAELARDLENSLVVIQGEIDLRTEESAGHQLKLNELTHSLTQWQQKQKDLADDKETLELTFQGSKLNGEYEAKKKALRDLENDAETNRLIAELQALDKRAAERDQYSPNCTDFSCAAIAEAIKAKERIPEAEERINSRVEEVKKLKVEAQAEAERLAKELNEVHRKAEERGRWIKNQGEVVRQALEKLDQDIRNKKQALNNLTALIDAKRKQMATNRAEVAKLKVLAEKLSEIQVAEQRKADLEKQLAETAGQGKAMAVAWTVKENKIRGGISALAATAMAISVDEKADASPITAQAEIKEIEAVKIPAIEKEIQAAREKIATLQAELSRIEAAEKELAEVQEQRDRLSLKISRWRYLQQACGKNGLQALEIDGAAPLISEQANKLLYLGYGPQFSIRIDTQDEEGREDLDIKVISEDGEDSIKLKSGGEKVWLLHPIRLAMTLLSKEKSGRDWDYSCFDEITGALDSKGASSNFMQMYRPYMEIGRIAQVFYITHQDECLAYADHVLKFEKGKNPWWG